jgi:hypothetical protein
MGYPNNKKDDPAEFEDVYAGPGMWSGEEPDDPEDIEEPEENEEMKKKNNLSRNEKEFACVYAGPEYFGIKDEPEEDKNPEEEKEPEEEKAPEEEKDPEEEKKPEIPPEVYKNMFDDRSYKPYEAVYAGPQYMMAYAGPQLNPNNGMNGFIGGMMPQQPPEEKKKKCESCGAEMPVTAKFCGKCGAKFKDLKFCPTCGSLVLEGSRFCCECGALLK